MIYFAVWLLGIAQGAVLGWGLVHMARGYKAAAREEAIVAGGGTVARWPGRSATKGVS